MPLLARVAASFLRITKKMSTFAAKLQYNMTIYRLFTLLLTVIITCRISAQDEVIEHQGNKYIIHVEQLNPDNEMTLLDVLHICPEFFSTDGKDITAYYLLSVDDIVLSVDYKPLLEGIKACELSEVIVCSYGAINNAMDGDKGSIDLQFKEGSQRLDGKLSINGSTYGNGRVYADITSTGEHVTVRGFAQTSMNYGSSNGLEAASIVSRSTIENAMVFVNWDLSERDVMRFKFQQGFGDLKSRITDSDSQLIWPAYERWGEFSGIYERTLNEKEAVLYIETGMSYGNNSDEIYKINTAVPSLTTEFTIPFNKELSMIAGWEIDYVNNLYVGLRREQYLNNDFYVQLDYTHGPWVFSFGDRFRINNFWNKLINDQDRSTRTYHRNENAFHASIGYKHQRHFIQGTFCRSYFNPLISDFFNLEEDSHDIFQTNFRTNLAWRAEARYNYQTSNFVLTSSLLHTWLTDMLTPNEYITGLRTSTTWNKGPLRLTVGVNFFHRHISSSPYMESVYNNFYQLKLVPIWQIGKGFRLSSVLLYNSRQERYYEVHPHLYASVKINKDLGKHINLYADFHDIAGQPTGLTDDLLHSYKNRALTIGLTYYPFRK